MQESIQMIAGGDIRPSRFMKISTAANHTLLEADANEAVIGISHEATKEAPFTGSSANAAAAGDPIHCYLPGDVCLLELGSGGCTAGDLLGSDGDGKGIANATDKRPYGARALTTAVEGEKAQVIVMVGFNAV